MRRADSTPLRIYDAPARLFLPLTGLALVVPLIAGLLAASEQWRWLILAGGAGGVLALLAQRPLISLMAVFSLLPFQSLFNDVFAGAFPLVAVAKDGLMLVLVFSLIIHNALRRRSYYLNSTLILLLLFALVCGLYALIAPQWMRAVLQLRFLVLYPLIILLAANCLETRHDLLRLLRLVAVVGMITVIYGLLQFATHFDVPYRLYSGNIALRMSRFDQLAAVATFADRPSYGGYLVPIFLLFLQVRLWPQWPLAGVLRLGMIGASGLCVLLTFSRSSWLALLIGTLVALYFRDKTKTVLGAMALCVGALLFFGTQLLTRSETYAESATSGESFQIRLSYWPLVLRHSFTNPLGLGIGTVGGPNLLEDQSRADIYGNLQYDPNLLFNPHAELGAGNMLAVTDNAYLKLLVQGGFPLLLLFLTLIWSIIRLARTVIRTAREPLLRNLGIWAAASIAALLTIFMFVDFMEATPAVALYWLVIGVLCAVNKLLLPSQDAVAAGRVA